MSRKSLSKIEAPAPTSGSASLRLTPNGTTAPASPVDGDMWVTTAGLFVRVNGVTVGPLGAGGSSVTLTFPYYSGDLVRDDISLSANRLPFVLASGSSKDIPMAEGTRLPFATSAGVSTPIPLTT